MAYNGKIKCRGYVRDGSECGESVPMRFTAGGGVSGTCPVCGLQHVARAGEDFAEYVKANITPMRAIAPTAKPEQEQQAAPPAKRGGLMRVSA